MRKSGFVTQADFESHKNKPPQVVHGIWPLIRGITVGPRPKGSVGTHTHAWADVLKTGSNLTDLATRQHAGLADVTANQHHPQSHTLASHSTKPHSALTDITHSQHHNKTHALTGVTHTVAGLTIGHVLRATGAAAFAWQQLQHGDLGGVGVDDHHAQVHNLLSSAHGDTVTHVCQRGAIITGDADDKWAWRQKGELGRFLRCGVYDLTWSLLIAGDLPSGYSHDDLVDVTVNQHHDELHAADHRVGEADALNVGTPVNIGGSNIEGSANNFARRDHVHNHPSLQADLHHPQSHTLASHSSKAHSELTDVTSDQHHSKNHAMVGITHGVAGLTIGWVIRASAADAFVFAQLQYSDLGGTLPGHADSHRVGAADALSIGIPVNIAHTNIEGSANNFARRDHVHAHPSLSSDLHHNRDHAAEHHVAGGDLVNHDSLTGFVGNEHINHTSVSMIAGSGLSGGGTIATDRTFNLGLLTAPWDAGSYQIRALKFYSDQATGTPPFIVLSTTLVTNLNADRWKNVAVSGLTIGHVLKATGAATIAFQANNFGGLSDVTLGSLEEGETIRYDQDTAKWVDGWGISYDNPRLVYKFYTDFFSATVDTNDPWVGAALGLGGKGSVTGTQNHPGIINFNSAATANTGYRFMTAVNCIKIGGAEHSEFCFKTGPVLTSCLIRLGYQDSLTSTAPTDGVWIWLAATILYGKTRNNGSESTTGTSYTVSASTWYRAKITVNSNATLVTFKLYSEAGNQLWSDTLSANIPTGRGTGHGVVAWVGAPLSRSLIDIDMMIATRAGYITR